MYYHDILIALLENQQQRLNISCTIGCQTTNFFPLLKNLVNMLAQAFLCSIRAAAAWASNKIRRT